MATPVVMHDQYVISISFSCALRSGHTQFFQAHETDPTETFSSVDCTSRATTGSVISQDLDSSVSFQSVQCVTRLLRPG